MNIPTASRERAERRDRALVLRRRITTLVAAAGVGAVGVIGYVVAQSPAKTTLQTVSTVPSLGEDTVTGDDAVQRASATSLSPGTATVGSPASATAVSGGSTVVKKP
jgi:cell division septal protein FtsQ